MPATMPVLRPAAAFLGLSLLLGARASVAEGLSTVEAIAFQDFMVWQCSRNEPARTAEFARLRSPPHTCAVQDASVVEQGRKSLEYQAFTAKLAREMGALSKRQLTEICQSALKTRC
jgi:hypothetical protein